MRDVMKLILVVILTLMVSGCAGLQAAGHKHVMRGQILEVSDSIAYLCVGSNDGAQIGQELTVYRFNKIPNPSVKTKSPQFKRQEIGKIKILEIVDEHMANATILSGDVKVNDVAETSR